MFPLLSNKPELVEKAQGVYSMLKKECNCTYDLSGSIGRRYARMDEIGTPLCITIDFETLKDDTVTVRERNTTKQIRVKIQELNELIRDLTSNHLEVLNRFK